MLGLLVGVLLGLLALHVLRGSRKRSVVELPAAQESIPPLAEQFGNRLDSLTREQLLFLRHLVDELLGGRYPPVNGQVGYLFLYLSLVFSRWRTVDLEKVRAHLIDLTERYAGEGKFVPVCLSIANDCLLAMGRYEEFVEQSEPASTFSTETHHANLRCNVAHHLGRDAAPIDLLRMSSYSLTPYTKKHPGPFRDALYHVFGEEAHRNGPWLARLIQAGDGERIYKHYLFCGCGVVGPALPFLTYCFYTGVAALSGAIREAEQRVRDLGGMPRIGEGWLAETELYYAIKNALPETEVIQHGRPEWLGRQHLDVWIPHWRVAVEYHGAQHFRSVEFVGGEASLVATQERDRRKQQLCDANGVTLLVATDGRETGEVIQRIRSTRERAGRIAPSGTWATEVREEMTSLLPGRATARTGGTGSQVV